MPCSNAALDCLLCQILCTSVSTQAWISVAWHQPVAAVDSTAVALCPLLSVTCHSTLNQEGKGCHATAQTSSKAIVLFQDEEDTSIFNMGIALDAAGTEAVFNFGSSNAAGGAGSTFTTHQQQQAEQEQAEKRLSQMQVNDLSTATQTGTNDLVWLPAVNPSISLSYSSSTGAVHTSMRMWY